MRKEILTELRIIKFCSTKQKVPKKQLTKQKNKNKKYVEQNVKILHTEN